MRLIVISVIKEHLESILTHQERTRKRMSKERTTSQMHHLRRVEISRKNYCSIVTTL